MTTDEAFNELLVKLFKDITEIEGRELVTEEFHDITYNDFHIIEGIGTKEAKTMTGIAKSMNVTTGTMTKAIEGLAEKGYVTRERSKGFAEPIVLNLGILVLTFGLTIKITIASIIGVLLAIIIYRLM